MMIEHIESINSKGEKLKIPSDFVLGRKYSICYQEV